MNNSNKWLNRHRDIDVWGNKYRLEISNMKHMASDCDDQS